MIDRQAESGKRGEKRGSQTEAGSSSTLRARRRFRSSQTLHFQSPPDDCGGNILFSSLSAPAHSAPATHLSPSTPHPHLSQFPVWLHFSSSMSPVPFSAVPPWDLLPLHWPPRPSAASEEAFALNLLVGRESERFTFVSVEVTERSWNHVCEWNRSQTGSEKGGFVGRR